MEEADQLCEQLFLWLEKQEQCIKKLLSAAEELENLHLGSNIVQVVGNVAALGGFAALATICTGGLAAPLTVPLVVAGIGTAVSLTPKAIESGWSHFTIKEAKKCMKEVEEIGGTIQMLMNELSAKCARREQGASAVFSNDESDEFEVNTQILGALARSDSMDVPLDLLRRFNGTIVINQQRLVSPDQDIVVHLMAGAAASFMYKDLKTVGKRLTRKIGSTGMKTAIKRTVLAAGSFVGVALAVLDLGRNIKEIQNKQTEDSRSLQTAAREMEENARNLRNTIDAQREINKKLSEFPTLLENLGGYSLTITKTGQKVLNYIKATCNDDTIISWMKQNQAQFLNDFRFLRDHLLKHLEEEIKKRNRRPAHIVFVAHGSITDEFMPASVLVPTPSITDTILYSPWNCKLNARAAAGIAGGSIRPHLRRFYNKKSETKVKYDRVPQRWNSMRKSKNKVPQILLGPVTPDEHVWKVFKEFGGFVWRDDRIIIPYLRPDKKAPSIPFYMLVFGASYILMFTQVTATVHLAACLGRGETRPMKKEWAEQYAFTEDGTVMSMNIEAADENYLLLRAFRMLFDNQQ